MSSLGSDRKKPKLIWSFIAITLLIAVAVGIGVWYVSDDRRSDTTAGVDDKPSQKSSTPAPSGQESRLCKKRVKGSPNVAIDIEVKPIRVKDGKFDVEYVLRQSSDYIAMDVVATVKFVNAGNDVTRDLGDEFDPDDWDNSASVFPNADNVYGDEQLKAPSTWASQPIKLDVSIDNIGYWCVPKRDDEGELS